jgi:hypothetical protein
VRRGEEEKRRRGEEEKWRRGEDEVLFPLLLSSSPLLFSAVILVHGHVSFETLRVIEPDAAIGHTTAQVVAAALPRGIAIGPEHHFVVIASRRHDHRRPHDDDRRAVHGAVNRVIHWVIHRATITSERRVGSARAHNWGGCQSECGQAGTDGLAKHG